MSPVLNSVNPVNFSLLFRSRFCHHCRWNISPNKIKIDFNLLRGLDAPLSISFMHQHLINKFIYHCRCQFLKLLIFINQCHKFTCRIFALLIFSELHFQLLKLCIKLCFFLGILLIQDLISAVRQFTKNVVLIDTAD